MKVGVKARLADWFTRWQPYLSLALLAVMFASYPFFAFVILAMMHWSALDALRKPVVSAPSNGPTPVGDEVCRMIEAVRFEKAMIGEGWHTNHSVTVRKSGKCDVYVLVSSRPINAKEYQ